MFTTFSRGVPRCTGAATFDLGLLEFSGIVPSRFTFSRPTVVTEASHIEPEDWCIPLLLPILMQILSAGDSVQPSLDCILKANSRTRTVRRQTRLLI